MIYEHQKAREIDNYVSTLAKRKTKLSEKDISQEYIGFLKDQFFNDEKQQTKSIEIAINILNENSPKKLSVNHII